jgi:hypothetical protein
LLAEGVGLGCLLLLLLLWLAKGAWCGWLAEGVGCWLRGRRLAEGIGILLLLGRFAERVLCCRLLSCGVAKWAWGRTPGWSTPRIGFLAQSRGLTESIIRLRWSTEG